MSACKEVAANSSLMISLRSPKSKDHKETAFFFFCLCCVGGLVSALNTGSSSRDSSPGWGHCVVFLGKTLNSHSAALQPRV